MNKTLTWAMIGCGSVTEKKSAPGLYKSRNSTLKSVYSRSYDKAADFAKRHNIPKSCRSLDEILNDKEIDAVYIATPPKSHKDYALKCLASGKIPYIEKPMALNYQECLEILKASEKSKIPVYVAYYRRGLEKFQYIKSLIDQGALGKISVMRITQLMKPEAADLNKENLPWKVRFEETGGGKFIDMGTHVLDLAQFFFGDFVEIKGIAANFGGFYRSEDCVAAIFECKSGVLVNGTWDYTADCNKEDILIIGSKASVETGGLAYNPVHITIDGKREIKSFDEPEHIAMPYEQMIIDEILGKAPSPADIISAANNVKTMDAILKDYRMRSPKN